MRKASIITSIVLLLMFISFPSSLGTEILLEDNFSDSDFNESKFQNNTVEPAEFNDHLQLDNTGEEFWSLPNFTIGHNISFEFKTYKTTGSDTGFGFYRNDTAVVGDPGEANSVLCGLSTGTPNWYLNVCGTSNRTNLPNPSTNGSYYRVVVNTTSAQCEAWQRNTTSDAWELQGNRSYCAGDISPTTYIFGVNKGSPAWHGIADLLVTNLSSAEAAGAPPNITVATYNVTSAVSSNQTLWRNDTTDTVLTADPTPSVSFDIDSAGNCSISQFDMNYTEMVANNSDFDCSTTDTVNHTCTLPQSAELELDATKNVFIGCIAGGEEFENSSSGPLSIKYVGSCLCPDPAANWVINATDGCYLADACNITDFNISFIDTGNVTFNTTINASGLGTIGSAIDVLIGALAQIFLHG